ncbi:TIM-barrel domain-containing protein [Microbacterium sp. NPDC076911]|uniref:glycoside hydrolase family 31 protein n=1 Tax=Microbacterium sp. NPDC076911 TaxID=3154958 RepID=UPI003438B845
MIRHRPGGSGHPYSVDTEQRDPVIPVQGEPLVLGVFATNDVTEVSLELSIDGAPPRALALERSERRSRGQVIDGGHLASAQARLARASGGWSITLLDLEAGATLRYRFTSDGGSTRWFWVRVAGWRPTVAIPGAAIAGTGAVLDDGERIHRVRFALELAAGEKVVGFGERFDQLDQRGLTLDSMVFEQYKSQGAERKTYMPMPFAHVVGGAGWGFHVRTSRRVWFDVGASVSDQLVIEVEVDAESAATDLVDLALYRGRPRGVLDSFLSEVGRPEELPDWVFRLWGSGNEWNTQAEVMRQIEAHREHDIPVGTVVIEAWSDESTFHTWRDAQYEVREDGRPACLADFTFPPDGAWPDPKGMIDELHERDVRLVLWQIPLQKMRPHPKGQAKADADAAVRAEAVIRETSPDGSLRPYRNRGWWFPLGLMPDLTDERAARWWTERRRYLVEEMGVDGFKTDGGEHAWGHDLVYRDGKSGGEKNNTFPVAYAAAYGDLMRSVGKPPVTFSRAGFTGSQAHGTFWAGDENSTWEAFRWSLTAGLTASASGILYWGWDVAGFSGDIPSAELYLRSIAAGAFVPIMQYHSEFNHHRKPSRDRTPWNIAARTSNDRVLPVTRRFAHIRERLVPYLAQESRAAILAGEPLMRPLFFDDAEDERIWEHPHQWRLGRDLLVAPVVTEGESERMLLLPEGRWVDAFTGERLRGGSEVVRATDWDEIPVYVREEAWEGLRSVFDRG